MGEENHTSGFHSRRSRAINQLCRILAVILVAGLLLYGTGQAWLRWGDSMGFDTPWGWTGISPRSTCSMSWRGHRSPRELSLWIVGRNFAMLREKTVCHCAVCESIRSFPEKAELAPQSGHQGD